MRHAKYDITNEKRKTMSEKILLSSEKKQFKANLHCHSTHSDGKLTPEELKAAYKSRGYDILAITDHCNPNDYTAMSDPDFMMLTGYEAYIRPTDGKSCPYKGEVHLNLFARDPHNQKFINFNSGFCKYLSDEEKEKLDRVGSERPREYTTEYINEFIRTAIENGYLVSYNHPFWSMEYEERVLSYENFFSVEIYNTGSYRLNGLENGEGIYDKMLRKGMHVGCHGADDNHNKEPLDDPDSDSFLAHTRILADKLEYGAIIDALDKKEYYASNGPEIQEIALVETEEGRFVRVKCSPAKRVFLFMGSKSTKHATARNGELLTEVMLPLAKKARYIRVSVCDADGERASSRGYFPEEWG